MKIVLLPINSPIHLVLLVFAQNKGFSFQEISQMVESVSYISKLTVATIAITNS